MRKTSHVVQLAPGRRTIEYTKTKDPGVWMSIMGMLSEPTSLRCHVLLIWGCTANEQGQVSTEASAEDVQEDVQAHQILKEGEHGAEDAEEGRPEPDDAGVPALWPAGQRVWVLRGRRLAGLWQCEEEEERDERADGEVERGDDCVRDACAPLWAGSDLCAVVGVRVAGGAVVLHLRVEIKR